MSFILWNDVSTDIYIDISIEKMTIIVHRMNQLDDDYAHLLNQSSSRKQHFIQ